MPTIKIHCLQVLGAIFVPKLPHFFPRDHTLYTRSRVIDISGKAFPISIRSLREAFGKALDKTGIKDFHFHDLRHTFATRLVQKGVDLYKIKELLGTISMTARYAHHYPESLRSSVELLDKLSDVGDKLDTVKVRSV